MACEAARLQPVYYNAAPWHGDARVSVQGLLRDASEVSVSEKIDLDELERKANAAEADEWEWSDCALRGKHNGQVVLFANLDARETDEPEIIVSWSNRALIAASSPPIMLALIARIRVLEAALFCEAKDLGNFVGEDEIERAELEQMADRMRAAVERGTVLP